MPRGRQPGALLYVEGPDDEVFFEKLRGYLRIPPNDLGLVRHRGSDDLLKGIGALRLDPVTRRGVQQIGVALDADADPAKAFADVCQALDDADLPAPTAPMVPTGKRPSPKHPRVTVLVLPGGGRPGMLEDLCLEAAGECPSLACADRYVDCLREEAHLEFSSQAGKRKFQVYLASCPVCHGHVGEAAKDLRQSPAWSWDHTAFDEVKSFLRLLAAQQSGADD